MKNLVKIVIVMIISIIVLNIVSIECYADPGDTSPIDLGKIFDLGNGFLNKHNEVGDTPISVGEMQKQAKPIAGILTFVGEGILVIIAIIMGIKYMVASPDEQAKLKKQLVGLVISAVVIFGAYGIWSLAYSFMTEVLNQ